MSVEPFAVPGDRVRLVPLAPSDAEDVAVAVQDPEIPRWTTIRLPYSIDDARQWTGAAAGQWRDGSPHWSIRTADGDRFAGALTLFASGPSTWEVGYWMGSADRGRGYMTEAVRLATRTAFDELGAHRVQWKAIAGNWASWKPVWRAGYRREGVLRGLTDRSGAVFDHWSAAIVRGDLMQPAAPWDGPGAPGAEAAPALDPSRPQQLVAQFHRTYSMPDRLSERETPTLGYPRLDMRMRLIAEEFSELVGAVYGPAARALVEDGYRRGADADDSTRDVVETADALADMVYVIYGMALESGIDLDAVLAEVQASNLSKLMPDGSVKLREDGKVLKGPNFFRPDIRRALGLPPQTP
ncbi:MAG: GNAT family N-acetyltransferase [Actinomyces sp.]|jgi:RimJ/RimL family protein N-acetyltransferase/predicted HAD superfamily Cof-like phosphohydrolase|nr:GNAT family N-acetyltransferase [Actinomyces sp.]MCI1641974.1 GNAT family N-acetyltransferase [Actinomyces sp.]MCI1662972.1 GNAT family N-acetyltransferase [Actinomyces sp.]MCI1691566.1 GNAT family N-acetyltransferase [Actinomyces sp.]MCI1788245.1 GNAT family N-acetyltransferase [Actinomyces sp.]MCI1830635.1 GNAT family N-acetyltransferase [Actinomyces sp.]